MVDIVQEDLNGETLLALPRPAPERRIKRRWACKNQSMYRTKLKRKALSRIAEAWNIPSPVCHICGCPHIEALTFGHPNGNGHEHRTHIHKTGKKRGHRRTPRESKTPYKINSGGVVFQIWITKATLEEIREWNVCIECTYCNFYESKNGHYPEPDKRPQWPLVVDEKEAREIVEMPREVK